MQDKPVSDKKDVSSPGEKPSAAADSPTSARLVDRPVIVNLGSARRKRIKELKRGTGKLMDRVRNAVDVAAADLSREGDTNKLLPVVVLYRRKDSERKKRRGGANGMCPPCCV